MRPIHKSFRRASSLVSQVVQMYGKAREVVGVAANVILAASVGGDGHESIGRSGPAAMGVCHQLVVGDSAV